MILVAEQVAILFALMAVGFGCRRAKLLTESMSGGFVTLLLYVVNPCLIINSFNRRFDPAMLQGLAIAFALGVATHLALMLFSRVAFRKGDEAARAVLKTSAVFSNAGFMGIPLEQALLGSDGVFYGVVYVVVFNLFMWSWGLSICTDGRLRLTRKMIVNPGMGGICLGLLLFFLPFELPRVVSGPLEMISAVNTPLAMIVIGFYLAGARFRAVLTNGAAFVAMAIRLLVGPLIVMALLYPFRTYLEATMMLAVVIPASAPVAAMVSMFAAQHNRDVDLSVALVSVTTLLSILTMPLMITLAMSLLGAN